MNDHFGNKIERGDIVVYPGRAGSSLWMSTAVVTDASGKSLKVKTLSTNYDRSIATVKAVSLSEVHRVVKVPAADLPANDNGFETLLKAREELLA